MVVSIGGTLVSTKSTGTAPSSPSRTVFSTRLFVPGAPCIHRLSAAFLTQKQCLYYYFGIISTAFEGGRTSEKTKPAAFIRSYCCLHEKREAPRQSPRFITRNTLGQLSHVRTCNNEGGQCSTWAYCVGCRGCIAR